MHGIIGSLTKTLETVFYHGKTNLSFLEVKVGANGTGF